METTVPDAGLPSILLRDVAMSDLPVFFEQQLDAEANWMAAFTSKDPTNSEAFMAHWHKILADETSPIQTILLDGQVAGYVLSYQDKEFGKPEVSYWIGKSYWGKGVATRGLAAFLLHYTVRPIYARAAKDNPGSLRVLEKCGFIKVGENRDFANARGQETEELILQLS